MKRSEVVGASLAVVVSVALWQFNVNVFRPKRYAATCQSNLKRIGSSMLIYVRDYDEKFPRGADWMTVLLPYNRLTKAGDVFVCPTRDEWHSGYAMNNRIGGLSLSQIPSGADRTVAMVFDSEANRFNANDNGSSLPKVFRHPKGNNLLFMDAHVALSDKAQFNFRPGPRPTPYRTPTPLAKKRQ